ncbi:MAG: hypothetical protein K2X27_07825 [Candidatus Obscuribacterales bacterium]|nr:hypothetical protein [Candidatus Obscuribacterales bacterium]
MPSGIFDVSSLQRPMTADPFAQEIKRAFLPSLWILLAACIIFSSGLFILLLAKPSPELAANIGFSLSGGLGLIGFCLSMLSVFKRQKVQETLLSVMNEDRAALEPRHGSALWIAAAAALSLYLELMIVRLQGNSLQLFAYYKNVSLMSCFLGLGIGYSLNKSRPLTLTFFLPLMAMELIFLNVLRWADLSYLLRNPAKEQATFEIYAATSSADMMISLGFIVTIFVLNALIFVPLGQLASQLMTKSSSLFCYGWNLIGSLFGVGLFALLSFLWMPPAIWMAIAGIGVLLFLRRERSLLPSVFAACIAVGLLAIPPRAFLFKPMKYDIYSPYQVLTVILEHGTPRIFANNTWLQSMVDLNPKLVAIRDDLKPIAAAYNLPYMYKPKPDNVLIVGSGTGNDIAAGIRAGAKDIDAVEIDPGIIQIGSSMHPENPYQYARVHIINDDARHYIRHSKKKYDLIVYGYLDSTSTLTANSGGVRMDSYVWTEEGFKEARALLKDDGIVSCTVCILPELTQKVFRMLEEAFGGNQPVVYNTVWDSGFTFIVSKQKGRPLIHDASAAGAATASNDSAPFKDLTQSYIDNKEKVDIATDDWPFLWMFKRSYPSTYALVIGLLTVISSFMVLRFLPSGEGRFSPSWYSFFFLGAGFMLVETKGITELALVWGSTWFVTSIVVAAVIALAFLANLLVAKSGEQNTIVSYLILCLSLAMGFSLSYFQISLASLGGGLERIVMTVLLTMPLFFSGLAFSSELRKSGAIGAALSANLLGGMVGGFLEYNSMYFGYRSLYIFALLMYLLAMLCSLKGAKKQAAGPAVS